MKTIISIYFVLRRRGWGSVKGLLVRVGWDGLRWLDVWILLCCYLLRLYSFILSLHLYSTDSFSYFIQIFDIDVTKIFILKTDDKIYIHPISIELIWWWNRKCRDILLHIFIFLNKLEKSWEDGKMDGVGFMTMGVGEEKL
jgi:hypothetical protein